MGRSLGLEFQPSNSQAILRITQFLKVSITQSFIIDSSLSGSILTCDIFYLVLTYYSISMCVCLTHPLHQTNKYLYGIDPFPKLCNLCARYKSDPISSTSDSYDPNFNYCVCFASTSPITSRKLGEYFRNLETQPAACFSSYHGASHSGASFVPDPGFVLCPRGSATQFPTILFPNTLLIATTILRDLISEILCLDLLKSHLPHNVL